MITWGINALNHDASIAVIKDQSLAFWERSSVHSKIPQDQYLNEQLVEAAILAGGSTPDVIVWYEDPWAKKSRQLYAGQYRWAFDLNELPSRYLKKIGLEYRRMHYGSHHRSHAAAGFLTSPYNDATVVVIDAIGEWETATIWQGAGTQLKKLWSRKYPNSMGLFYSAFTKLIGYQPIKEEHLLQRDSELGDPNRYYAEVSRYFSGTAVLTENLHRGVTTWPHSIACDQDRYDIAAAVQKVFEMQVYAIMLTAKQLGSSKNLVYMGGCAMNSKFNKLLPSLWDNVWIFPVPGDAGSSLGAALYHQQCRIAWK